MTSNNWTVLASLLAALALASCQDPFDPGFGAGQGGSLTVTLNELVSHKLLPEIDMNPAGYDLAGSGPDGASFDETVAAGSSTTMTDLAFGEWTVTATAKNSAGTAIGQGSGTVTVLSNAAVSLVLTVRPYDGFGSLVLEVRWPAAQVQTARIDSSLTPHSGGSRELEFSVNGPAGTAGFSADDVATGYHTLVLKLLDNGHLAMGTVQVVRIVKGQTTSGSFEFTSINQGTGSLEVNIGPEMGEPLDVHITGSTATKPENQSLPLSAVVSNYSDNVSFIWHVNGDAVQTGSSFILDDGWAQGYYQVDVTAFSADGSRGGSAGAFVEVVEPVIDPVFVHEASIDGLPVPRFYTALSIAENGVCIGSGAGVFLSTDYGLTWTSIPEYEGSNIRGSVISRDASAMFFIAFGEGVFRSLDGGENWEKVYSNGTDRWWRIAVSGDGRVVATEEWDGALVMSRDGGDTWTAAFSSGMWSTVSVSDDGSHVLAATNDGRVKVSEDGGITWENRTVASQQWRHSAVSADGRYMSIHGRYSESIYRSEDWGSTWQVVPGTGYGQWQAMAMSLDGRTQVAAASTRPIYLSEDFGATFTPLDSTLPTYWNALALEPEGDTILAGVGSGYLYRSGDLGQSWIRPQASVGQRNWRGGDATADNQSIYAFGYAHDGEALIRSLDGGNTWQIVGGVPSGRHNDVAVSGDGSLVVIATSPHPSGGGMRISTDGGSSWTLQDNPGSEELSVVAVDYSGSTIVVGVRSGDLRISYDHGSSWSSSGVSASSWTDIDISDDGQVIAATSYSPHRTVISTDGGKTWDASANSKYLSRIAVSGDGTHLVTGTHDLRTEPLYSSRDGGLTWTPLTSLGALRVGAISLDHDGDTIIAGGYGEADNRALISLDGGDGWTDLGVKAENNYEIALASADGREVFLFSRKVHRWHVSF